MIISSHNNYKLSPPQVFFGAGKVKLFSDFDGTYLPAEHKTLSLAQSKKDLNKLETYFAQVNKFLAKNKSGFQFTITTGRNLCEFRSIINHCQRLGLKMPLPDTLIIKNGADEYLKSISDDEFYRTGANPFQLANENKRKALKETIGWDGPLIREKLIETLQQNGFRDIRQDGTTNSAEDYGKDSTLYHVHDRFHEDPSKISPWTTVLRQDGDLKFFIGLPKDMQARGDRRHAQFKIQEKIERDLRAIAKESNGHLGFSIKYRAKDGEYGNHPSITIVPKINGHELTKVYDTHQAVTDATTNTDLVITAGDGSNDFEMLNPASYLTLPPEMEAANHQTHFVDKPTELLKILATNKALKEKFDQLPFKGIVIERNGHIPKGLQSLVDAYGSGPNPKIIKVQEGTLFEGILEAIKNYQSQDAKFAALMNNELKASLPIFQSSGFYPRNTPESFQNTTRAKDSFFSYIKKIFQAFFKWLKGLFTSNSTS